MNKQTIKDVIKRVRRIEIQTKRIIDSPQIGRYGSVFKGQGLNFTDVREYVPGDEVRSIDWNVTARAGRPFIKRFTEERELTLLLAIDVSASENFGSQTQSKRELAAELACVLAFSAARNQDRVGLLLFSDEVELYVPPKKGKKHALRLVREILAYEPRHRGTSIASALDFVNHLKMHRGVVFLFSDFQASGDQAQALTRLKLALDLSRRRHDLVALHVSDPREQTLPDVGLLAIEDAESGELIEIDTGSSKVRESFAAQAAERLQAVRKTLRRAQIDTLEVSTATPYFGALARFFDERSRRRSRS